MMVDTWLQRALDYEPQWARGRPRVAFTLLACKLLVLAASMLVIAKVTSWAWLKALQWSMSPTFTLSDDQAVAVARAFYILAAPWWVLGVWQRHAQKRENGKPETSENRGKTEEQEVAEILAAYVMIKGLQDQGAGEAVPRETTADRKPFN